MVIFYWMIRHLLLRQCKLPYIVDFFVFETVIAYAMNIPLVYAAGSLFHIYMRGENLTPVHTLPSFICIIIWFLSSQNPFGIFKRLTSFLEKKLMKKTYESEERVVDANETEIDLDE